MRNTRFTTNSFLFRSASFLKTQIEDSPATDNKLESIVDQSEEETDEGESEELVHDDSEDKQDVENSKETSSVESEATEEPRTNKEEPPSAPPVLTFTGDGVIERLLAAEVSNSGTPLNIY